MALHLKFGDIKGGDFADSPEALMVFEKMSNIDPDSPQYKEEIYKVIDLFNGPIINWWGQEEFTKEQAKEYVKNYKQ